jgi:hypothetical protein
VVDLQSQFQQRIMYFAEPNTLSKVNVEAPTD